MLVRVTVFASLKKAENIPVILLESLHFAGLLFITFCQFNSKIGGEFHGRQNILEPESST